MSRLVSLVETGLRQPTTPQIANAAGQLQALLGGDAVLFYGSALRTGDLDGVLDFYVLWTDMQGRSRRSATSLLWPDVSYHEFPVDGLTVRAKVAAMPMAAFERMASGETLDTTIWTRFSQPSRLLFARSPQVAERVSHAIATCVRTATQFALVLGPASGRPADYWSALFAQTYGAEFRIENQSRRRDILAMDPDYYDKALRYAWAELGFVSQAEEAELTPAMTQRLRRTWTGRWRNRRLAGKGLNVARLVKASRTFDGAASYALWKIERHSGVHIPLTPWREQHPVLAAPGVLFRLWQARRR